MEIVIAVVTLVVESMVPIKKHLRYLISSRNYVHDMDTKMRDLDVARLDVEEHVERNRQNILEVPTEVMVWLEQVAQIDAQVKSIPSDDVGSCFNIKRRHKLGRKAFKIIKKINLLREENKMINWSDRPIPLGKVDSMKPSTYTPSTHHNDFKSRERTFMEALKALQPDHKSQMIALCGMGGVGKTTMMEKLKKVVAEKKIFDFIVEATMGETLDPIVIQQSVAESLGVDLKESTKAARASKIQKGFETRSEGGKKKILVILDDLWELVDLKDIGLSPLPNQGVGFKFLLTSRDRSVCIRMGVEVNSIFNVDVIEELEAQNFFQGFVQLSSDDHELHKIGEDIARKCCGLPIAIKTIALTLKGKNKDAWKDALSRLELHDIDQVLHEVFEMSYKNLQDEETKSIFLLCGLFPEDFDIPKEDLVRYAWGLELLNKVYSIRHARNRLNACIERLTHANLLIHLQNVGCVKMHDLVRDFVLYVCSKGEHTSIVGNMSNWPTKLTRESCKRISLSCRGMFEFPRNFKFPNLSLFKLMHGDRSLKFHEDFYEDMKQLQVIAYDIMECPLPMRSLQCSNNLRTLCLHRCSLMFDCSSIGNLLNLEVLSFAHCSMRELPSTIGNLMELKLLDLTGCVDLCIDDGVLKNLVKLEELYMRVANEKSIRFTDNNLNELAERLKNLFTLEIDFFDNTRLPKNISFTKLERFKISLGCYLRENNGQNKHSFENTLMLVTDKCELLDSGMYELFEKTEVLHLQVDGINDLGDVLADDINDLGDVSMESLHHNRSSFYNLRVLEVCECANLTYLFTDHVANGLTKLERLTVSFCHVLETLINGDNGGVGVIKFQALKFLSLGQLPKLTSLCNVVNVIELPQLEELILYNLPNFTSIYPDNNKPSTSSLSADISGMQPFFNKQVVIPQLKILKIFHMNKLKEIWPSELSDSDEVGLSELRVIRVEGCDRLVNLFPINPMHSLHHLDEVTVWNCGSIDGWGENKSNGEMVESSQKEEKEINVISNRDISEVDDNIPNAAFPSYLIHIFDHLHTLRLRRYKGVEVVFEIESSSSRNNQQKLLFPYLKDLELYGIEMMTHVWKCNWNKLLISQQEPQSSFANLTNITLDKCIQIKYVFSPLMAKYLYNLKSVRINSCDAMEEVVSNRDDEDEEIVTSISSHTNTNFFPHLNMLRLQDLRCLKRIDGVDDRLLEYSQVGVADWSMCQHFRRINIMNCDVLLNVIPTHAIRQELKLEELDIYGCPSMEEIFEIKGVINNNMIFLPNLTILRIECCDLLENIFASSTLESLQQLKELSIKSCSGIQVIVKEENEELAISSKVVVFPRLMSLSLADLPNLKGFFLGKNEFQWLFLDKVEIYGCPQMTTFTSGLSIAPELQFIRTRFGKHTLEGGLNFDWTSVSDELLILQENIKKMKEDHQAHEAERRARKAELELQLLMEQKAERAEREALAAKIAELKKQPKAFEEYIRRFPPPPN